MSGPRRRTTSAPPSFLKLLGFMAIFASGITVFAAYTRYEAKLRVQDSAEAVAAETGGRAAKLQEWLLRVDRTLTWFRAEDVMAQDRLAVTVRMLHTERLVEPANTLFLVSAAGRLIAGTLPIPDGAAGVATQPWFKSIQGSPVQLGLRLTGCTRNPFGKDDGVVVYRSVFDHDALAGYVGTFLPQSALSAMVTDDDPSNGTVTLALQSDTAEPVGCRSANATGPNPQPQGFVRAVLSRIIHASPMLSQHSVVIDDEQVGPDRLHLIGTADAMDTMSDADWNALAYRASYVAISLLLIMALMSSLLHRFGRPARSGLLPHAADAATVGGDWMWELDDAGNLVGLAGNAPDHLLPPSGRSLPEVAGPIGGNDMRWAKLTAAICAKQAFEGLQVPFQIPGRAGLLTIFEFSGQPVLASGGFWGTACLVSEESVAQAVSPAMARSQLSVA